MSTMKDAYWANVDAALDKVRDNGDTVEQVITILKEHFVPSSGEAFCEGSGGDRGLADALFDEREGWSMVWYDAHYYWCAEDVNGNQLSYIEGDVERGNCKQGVRR